MVHFSFKLKKNVAAEKMENRNKNVIMTWVQPQNQPARLCSGFLRCSILPQVMWLTFMQSECMLSLASPSSYACYAKSEKQTKQDVWEGRWTQMF